MDKNHKQTHKDFLVFGGEGIVMIHRTPTVQNQPVYTPVSSSHPVTTVPAEVGNRSPTTTTPPHTHPPPGTVQGCLVEGTGGKTSQQNTQALKLKRSVYRAPNLRGLESCRDALKPQQ